MGKKAALFDTEEFNIKSELKQEVSTIETSKHDSIVISQQSANEVQKAETKKKPYYLRLELPEDSRQYIELMSNHQKVSMTKYINDIINKDKKKNTALYEKLKEVENLKIKALNEI